MSVKYVFFQAFPELGDMDSDDEFHEYEPDPSKIATHWEKSSKSKNDKGVLHTHDRHFKWYQQQIHYTDEGFNVR